jgi:hypothetical protein
MSTETPVRGPNSIAHEVTTLGNRKDTALPGMEYEAERGQAFPDLQEQALKL